MTDKNYLTSLNTLTKIVLETENYRDLRQAVHDLHDLFAEAAHIFAGNIIDNDIFLETGKAVSTIRAAHCLLEMERTRRFLRGVKKAVDQLLSDNRNKQIQILYAGCGPYATLLTPMTSIYSAEQVSFTLMDINQASLDAAEKLYRSFGLMDYIKNLLLADATTYRSETGTYDLIVSETMLNALQNEPQVSIAGNLMPQLKAGGIFIPQQITVTAALLNSASETNSFFISGSKPERKLLGTVYQCDQPFTKPQEIRLDIPEITTCRELALLTEIDTYGGEILKDYSCSLTQPHILTKLEPESRFSSVVFDYVFSAAPHFSYRLIENFTLQAN